MPVEMTWKSGSGCPPQVQSNVETIRSNPFFQYPNHSVYGSLLVELFIGGLFVESPLVSSWANQQVAVIVGELIQKHDGQLRAIDNQIRPVIRSVIPPTNETVVSLRWRFLLGSDHIG
jgi:hypothetical protein